MFKRLRLFFVFMALLVGASWSMAVSVIDTDYRLSADVEPLAYRLDLTIDPGQKTFSGQVDIGVRLHKRTKYIVLHAQDLSIQEAFLTFNDKRWPLELRATSQPDQVAFKLPRKLKPSDVRLSIRYQAPFNKDLKGLYTIEDSGLHYAFTQFEPIAARSVFPGFDEPRFKTPFDLSVTTPANNTVVANTPLVERLPLENGQHRWRFAPTTQLPTYLVALAVGELDVVEAKPIAANAWRKHELPLRGVTAKGQSEHLAYAFESARALLNEAEAYFGSAYPFAKLDVIAVPEFAAGAMENVGAITFKESLLLIKPDAPINLKRRHASIMAHELAHMWFGNLVTMQWWDDLWLNEAFATWMSYKLVDAWEPEQKAYLAALGGKLRAMRLDRLPSSRQVRQPVLSNHDIANAFDGITYSKGAAILTMAERYMGEDAFKQAVRQYIAAHAAGNATMSDFLQALNDHTDENIATSIESWVSQNGVVQIQAQPLCNSDQPKLMVRQTPYSLFSRAKKTWNLPVCARALGSGKKECWWVSEALHSFNVSPEFCDDSLWVNADFDGYYHSLMPPKVMQALSQAIESNQSNLSALDEIAFADAVATGMAAGQISFEDGFKHLEHLLYSQWPGVRSEAMRELRFIKDQVLKDIEASALFNIWGEQQLLAFPVPDVFSHAALEALPTDTERLALLDVARFKLQALEDAKHLQNARALGFSMISKQGIDFSKVPKLSARLALHAAINDKGIEVFDALHNELKRNRFAGERAIVLYALAKANQPLVADHARQILLSDSVNRDERFSFFMHHLRVTENQESALNWLEKNLETIVSAMPEKHAIKLPNAFVPLCTVEAARRLDKALANKLNTMDGGPRNLQLAKEAMAECVLKVKRYEYGASKRFKPLAKPST